MPPSGNKKQPPIGLSCRRTACHRPGLPTVKDRVFARGLNSCGIFVGPSSVRPHAIIGLRTAKEKLGVYADPRGRVYHACTESEVNSPHTPLRFLLPL
jgi:hypothetical protein